MKSLLKILTQTIPVILGVLIALFIDSWKQGIEDQKFLDKIYSNIEKEMTSNIEIFETTLPSQKALVDSIAFHKMNQEVSLYDVLIKTGGLEIPNVSNTSWNSFLNSKLEIVDFKVITVTTRVEEFKANMKSQVHILREFLLDNVDSKDPKNKETVILHLKELMQTEEQLLRLYNNYIEWTKKNVSR